MKKIIILTMAALLFFSAADSASASRRRHGADRPLPATASTDIRTISAETRLNGDFEVVLEAPELPGYTWSNYNSLPPGVSLVSVSRETKPAPSPEEPPTLIERRRYHAITSGRNRMIFKYERPGDEAPLRYVICNLNVKLP
ncbi:MAG: hypothetical protein Q4D58_02960 [Synergistaceae bacterium]|nr:hypothetical protein [Synergistaceae bacterium]